MKVEITEDAVKLIPETEFEKTALENLRTKGIEKVAFQDDWDFQGPLILSYTKVKW